MEQWNNFNSQFRKFKIDLFTEYNKSFSQYSKKNIVNYSNFNNKMIALHEIFDFDPNNYSGFVISFEKEANLTALAKLQFYSDCYGENLIHEIAANKKNKQKIESVVFNQTKVWMYYHTGSRVFNTSDWNLYTN